MMALRDPGPLSANAPPSQFRHFLAEAGPNIGGRFSRALSAGGGVFSHITAVVGVCVCGGTIGYGCPVISVEHL